MKIFAALLLSSCLLLQAKTQVPADQPNFIFIVFDDLNDYVEGLGGHAQTLTPNLAALMDKGVVFTNAVTASTVCAPSRTSFLTGKAPDYTGIFNNDEFSLPFRDMFPPGQMIVTIPEWLKDSAGYFTYDIDKIFHCGDCEGDVVLGEPDFDTVTMDPCERQLSWNKQVFSDNLVSAENEGIMLLKWAQLDSLAMIGMADFQTAQRAENFIESYSVNPSIYCDKPFFLAVGIRKPHTNLYIPEQYFMQAYLQDFYAEPYDVPYNDPFNAEPANGVIMPPQPVPAWSDYYSLPELGKKMVGSQEHLEFTVWPLLNLDPLPEIDTGLTEEERLQILSESKRANAVMAYLAAVRFADEQLGKIITSLEEHPDLYNNTIVVVTSDHGYALGEKTAWGKGKLWETNIRVPLIIADLRDIQPGVSDRTVSLLDLFPTFCDYAGVSYPEFPDNSNYLDGYSLLPLMNAPGQAWERPATTQIKPQDLVCFPQNSVRNQKWHYIYYKSDNAPGETGCNEALSYNESELYEIGELRETDPEEWYNLVNDPAYDPVEEYMQQFLPDSSLYLKKMHSVSVVNANAVPCLLQNNAKLKLKAQVYSPSGTIMTAPELTGYAIEWTNNLTDAVYTGPNLFFLFSTIPPPIFAANEMILFYIHVYDPSGNLVAFNTKKYYLNPSTAPVINFSTTVSGATVSISSYTLTGNYTNTNWDFGDGFSTDEYLPAPHTYASSGIYTIKNFVAYGNGCVKIKSKNVLIEVLREGELEQPIKLYPVPATEVLSVSGFKVSGDIRAEIVDVTGRVVLHQMIPAAEIVQINIRELPQGVYVLKLTEEGRIATGLFEIMR